MPLHLLSKKSWNVYAPGNIARVKRDQAQAKAREEEADRQLQHQDAEERLAALRGEVPAIKPRVEEHSFEHRQSGDGERHEHDRRARDDKRRRRRLHGEDDTDRDLRLAREDIEARHSHRDHERGSQSNKRKRTDAPITDRNGHINLFPNDERAESKDAKVDRSDAMNKRKQQEFEDQCTMRFSNAAGRDGLKQGPWYAKGDVRARAIERENMEVIEGKDVWGRPDPSAPDREKIRQNKSDPLAFMMCAQTQFKRAEQERQSWEAEQRRRLEDVERDYQRARRLEKLKRRERRSREEEDEHRTRREDRRSDLNSVRRQQKVQRNDGDRSYGEKSGARGHRKHRHELELENFRLDD